jgi:hypothetical protein
MKQNLITESWIKKHSDKELSLIYFLIKDEKIRQQLPYAAFLWTVKESKELSNITEPISAVDRVDVLTKWQKGLILK